jgi:hypothetical protein
MVKEKCISCESETPYDFDTHIDYRSYYVEGLGQLCRTCFYEDSRSQTTIIEVPIKLIRNTPNDMELGKLVRTIYHKTI